MERLERMILSDEETNEFMKDCAVVSILTKIEELQENLKGYEIFHLGNYPQTREEINQKIESIIAEADVTIRRMKALEETLTFVKENYGKK